MTDVNVNFPPTVSPNRSVTAGDVESMVTQVKADVEGQVSVVTAQLAETVKKVNGATPDVNGNVTIEVPEVDTSTLATKTELNAVASGSPKGAYATLADLQSAFPTGNANMYVVSADGKWYTWNGSAWTAGAFYTSAVTSPSIVKNKTFATADNRFEEIENETYFLAGNKVKNGDFSNGKTDWYIPYSTSTVANNELSVVLTSKSAAGRIEQLYFPPDCWT